MKVIGLDNKEYNLNTYLHNTEHNQCSSLHLKARLLLSSLFPFDIIYEEVGLPGTKPMLFLDFFLKSQRLGVEVQGQQHYNYNSHFFKSALSFYSARARDRKKREWCLINQIQLVELPYTESEDEWKQRLLQ